MSPKLSRITVDCLKEMNGGLSNLVSDMLFKEKKVTVVTDEMQEIPYLLYICSS